jgi:putative DNA methylase
LLCLGLLLKEIVRIEDEHVREQMICLFSSTLEFNNLFCSYKGEGTGAVRHMFSHHILKPERTPIENSVWGTCKGSGTFSTLFESRLMPAKRYLDQPFEVAHMRNLFDEISGSEKLVASDPINVKLAASWQGLIASPNGVLILNGDSSSLPLPDLSVDAVVTDPPYFDFVNYSELSDFFFAWLAPTLKDKYAWFDQPDSSHPAEVQHNDPHVFARHLASVFSECHRTLKDAGVLAFSFHHSRTEGWAAIYEAISTTGFAVVAAHPVHAELRCSSPKTATKEPISLDAILVCRKTTVAAPGHFDRTEILRQSQQLTKKLSDAGMSISRADEFVVLASRSLISASAARYSVTQFKDALDSLREQPVGANTVLHRVRR